MNQKISIIGSGWLGLELGINLARHGNEIKISTTSSDKIKIINKSGLTPFFVELNNPGDNLNAFLDSEVLFFVTGNKNIQSYQALISKIEASSIQKVLFVSSTSVYPNTNSIVSEESPISDSPLTQIEELFRINPNFKTTIVRFGGLFGYDRKPGNFFKKRKTMQNPEGCINLIHRDDCISILCQILEKNIWNETFNACTDSHPTRREFYTKQIKLAGQQLPSINEKSHNEYKIVSSEKLKERLDFSFKYTNLMAYKE